MGWRGFCGEKNMVRGVEVFGEKDMVDTWYYVKIYFLL
jgi:hypothetical protein